MHKQKCFSGVPEVRLEPKSCMCVFMDALSAFLELTPNLISYSLFLTNTHTRTHTIYAFPCIKSVLHLYCIHVCKLCQCSFKTVHITYFGVWVVTDHVHNVTLILCGLLIQGQYRQPFRRLKSSDQEFELHFALRAQNHISYLQIKLFKDLCEYNPSKEDMYHIVFLSEASRDIYTSPIFLHRFKSA